MANCQLSSVQFFNKNVTFIGHSARRNPTMRAVTHLRSNYGITAAYSRSALSASVVGLLLVCEDFSIVPLN